MLASDGPAALVPWLTELIKQLSPKLIVIDSFRAIHDLSELAPGDASHGVRSRRTALRVRRRPCCCSASTPRDDIRALSRVRGERLDHPARAPAARHARRALSARAQAARLVVSRGAARVPHHERWDPALPAPHLAARGDDVHAARRRERPRACRGSTTMLEGGVWAGTTTLLVGPTGSGKTTVAMHFALEGIARKEPTLYVNFQENPAQLARSFSHSGRGYERNARAAGSSCCTCRRWSCRSTASSSASSSASRTARSGASSSMRWAISSRPRATRSGCTTTCTRSCSTSR